MKKLLVICGSTATGKTKLALRLAKKFDGELVSADSRQVYKGMDIGTGKDLPVNVKCQMSNVKCFGKNVCYYDIERVKLWGYDLVEPAEEFSVAQYIKIAKVIIENIWKRGKLPISVGGTGFYIQAVVDDIETLGIPKNKKLRESLGGKHSDELFELLTRTDPVKAASLNISDKRNPMRLIRAIEISSTKTQKKRPKTQKTGMNVLFIGLKANKQVLDKLIENRVGKRIKQGFENEFNELIEKGVKGGMQSMKSMGYRQFVDFKLGKIDRHQAILNWKKEEKKYAKRQITWFKRDKRINWFDITKDGWLKNVEKLVDKWYKVE